MYALSSGIFTASERNVGGAMSTTAHSVHCYISKTFCGGGRDCGLQTFSAAGNVDSRTTGVQHRGHGASAAIEIGCFR